MLYDYTKYFLYYLIAIYGGEYEVRGTTLWIWNERDEFHVNLLDGTRFDKYTFYHRNKYGNTKYCYKQFRCEELEYGIARCLTHAFYKEIGIDFTHEDWKKISADALKYKLLTNEE